MADGEQISHLITMIHLEADSAHNSVVSEIGYLNRLQKEIDSGGFASDGTLEIMMLNKSEKYLRETADKIEQARLQLLSNAKSKIRVINITGEPF